jgi:hypothetical protein
MLGNIVLLAILLLVVYLAATGKLTAVWKAVVG